MDSRVAELLERAFHENQDAIQVLSSGGLHPDAALRLQTSAQLIGQAQGAVDPEIRDRYMRETLSEQVDALNILTSM